MKSILYSLIAFLFVTGIALGTLLYREKIKFKQYVSLSEVFVNKNADLTVSASYRRFENDLNGKDLSNSIEISDGKGNPVDLSHLFDRDRFVLFFSDSHCDECVATEIDKLNKLSDYERIVVLISTANSRYVAQYKGNHNLRYPVYEVKTSQKQILSILSPFYFVLEAKSKRVNSTFVPVKHQPEETNQYLNKIIRDYF
jgi:hypothetical protein